MAFTQEEIRAARLDDFRRFLIEAWAYLRLPRPTPVQMDIARWLQHANRRVILQAFRGVGKSWITVAFVLWCLLLNPQLKIMVVSANEDTAKAFTKFCKQLIHGMPLLQHLAPRASAGHADSVEAFDVGPATPSKDPSVKSVGITGQLTGSRADIIIVDDVEIPKNSLTHHQRERLAELVKEFDAILKPGGRIIYLGTPQVEDSLYVKLQARGYETTIWPVQVPEKVDTYKGRLGPLVQRMLDRGDKPGTPVDPLRFPREDIMERRLSYGAAGFALQFMLDTSLQSIEQYPLKLRDLIIMDIDEDLAPVKIVWGCERTHLIQDLMAGGLEGDAYYSPVWRSQEMEKYTGTVMFIDPSGRGKDETTYAIVKFLRSQLFLVAVGGFRDGFSEATLKAIALKAMRHKVNYIAIEKNYGGGMFDSLLKPWLAKVNEEQKAPEAERWVPHILTDEEWRGWSKGQKELRILDTLEPIVQSHRLIVSRKVIEEDIPVQQDRTEYSFVQQFTRMWRQKDALPHEDRLEAVAGACAYFVEKMAQDRDRAIDSHREELLEQELRRFHENCFGLNDRADNYRWN